MWAVASSLLCLGLERMLVAVSTFPCVGLDCTVIVARSCPCLGLACAGFSYSEAFVFTLSPLPRAFWWTGANGVFLRVRNEGLFLGSDG